MGRILAMLGALAALTACVSQETPSAPPLGEAERAAMIENGRAIAETDCAVCHAIGVTDTSPNPNAPPLRTVLARYDEAALTANLMEGIRVGHQGMPIIQIRPEGADALVEYLHSIQVDSQP